MKRASDSGAALVIDSEARDYLTYMQSLGLPTLAEQGVEEARRLQRMRAPMLAGELEPVARIEDTLVPGPRGSIGCRVYAPGARPSAAGSPLYAWRRLGGWRYRQPRFGLPRSRPPRGLHRAVRRLPAGSRAPLPGRSGRRMGGADLAARERGRGRRRP